MVLTHRSWNKISPPECGGRNLDVGLDPLWLRVKYTQTRGVKCKTTSDTTTPHPIFDLLPMSFSVFSCSSFSLSFHKIVQLSLMCFFSPGLPCLGHNKCSSPLLPPAAKRSSIRVSPLLR